MRFFPTLRILSGLVFSAILALGPSFPQQPKTPPLPQPPQSQEQQKKDQEGFKIGVEVGMVTVPITVRQREGGFVKDLPQKVFHIYEDGEEQEILLFAQEGVPTRIAIVLDISGSVQGEWGTIKASTRRFAENLVAEDQFAIVTFNTEIRLKMDWGRKIDRIDPVLGSIYCKGETNLWDAIWVTSNDVLKGVREKKAMIIMTDGLDNNSTMSYEEALRAAEQSEAAVYVVSKTEAVKQTFRYSMTQAGYYNNVPQEVFRQADLALRKLAFQTGGRVLYPNSFGQLNDIYKEVDEELRNQYTVGYISSNKFKDGSYRHIDVRVEAPGAMISARPGYYAPNQMPGARPKNPPQD
jgi:Ca-activated chloride channel family protein